MTKAAKIYDPGRMEGGNTVYLTVADKAGNIWFHSYRATIAEWDQVCVLPD
jgi:gamma-glutamyltranspeptidase